MPAAAVKPAVEDMVAEGAGVGERGASQWEAPGLGRDRPPLPSLKVPRELLRRFPHSKRVGSYLVGKMINKGSFAKVMEGLHIGTGEKVAIKVIDKKKARQDSYVLKNMKREPRIHQMVRHPHIVVLLETLETENSYYMAMELCAGGDLMDRICERKRLEEREVRRYTRQILSAVEHLHKHGIVHRDLKIENFLLDEHNNIKIVDFGLSNTLKAESLSLELLSTQCGSPAYAAPELLAHRKYGPKVDVWSVVSMFAMLTGTLPFTVEPFNIKQLHQKMVSGEISSIPADISKGAVTFVLSLLEPDPEKRPSVKAAMEEKWINEGYSKRPLHTLSHKNRLCPEDLNSSVLAYMTETLGYSLSEIINTLTTNRPCAIMAAYHLLLSKFNRSQKGAKAGKVHPPPNTDFPSPCRRPCPPRLASPSDAQQPADHGATDEEIAITVDTREVLFPEVPVFGDRELVHLSPPKTSASQLCDSAPCQVPLPPEPIRDGSSRPVRHTHLLRTTQSDGADPGSDCFHDDRRQDDSHHRSIDERLEKLQTFYSADKNGVSPRMLLDAEAHSPERAHLGAMETAQTSPSAQLPRLRNLALKDGRGRKMTWRRAADLNLPLLPAALQGKADRKNQLHSMEY
ncbi:hormonally up-regulated neu tumor-associated kinase-like [Salarias fasciatus]|uniref:hormonally up-regulated neu tumor-associated kinase-like n=1 Tax=Salarias fasciatus TaxID=181472 RepID=UPI001176C300|nr:hormonally up-regulated neu tumor-associated kinase-like [Salarias fasciatus]